MGFFSNRRKRESAVPESPDQPALGSFASPEGQPVVGRQVGGGELADSFGEGLGAMDGLAVLAQLGPMIQQAMAQGNVQGEAQTLDLRGTEIGEEIREIMSQHGIEPGGATAEGVDADSLAGMQQQILQALARHGLDPK